MYKTVIKNESVDGLSDWVWPKEDCLLWEGSKNDWHAIREYITKNCLGFNTAVQAGGACGMYPKLLSKIFNYVYTFEPDPYNFYCLAQNCKENNIFKFNAALSDRHRTVTLVSPDPVNRGTGAINRGSHELLHSGKIPALIIDDFVFEKLDLIFLDVEGYEKEILKGAKNTINKHKPLISCETTHTGAMDILKNYGYSATEKVSGDTFFKFI